MQRESIYLLFGKCFIIGAIRIFSKSYMKDECKDPPLRNVGVIIINVELNTLLAEQKRPDKFMKL